MIVVTYIDFICFGFNDFDTACFIMSYIMCRLDDGSGLRVPTAMLGSRGVKRKKFLGLMMTCVINRRRMDEKDGRDNVQHGFCYIKSL